MPKFIVHEDPASLINANNLSQKTIRVTSIGENLLFSVMDESGDDTDLGKIIYNINEINTQIKHIGDYLGTVVTRKYENNIQEKVKLTNLIGLGKFLFRKLIPFELQMEIQTNWSDGININISSNENWIPWELFHDGKDFLGKRFMLFRLPRKTGFDIKTSNINHKIENENGSLKITHIIGGDITEEYVIKSNKCFEEWDGVSTLYRITLDDLFRQCSGADILHLTCHGKTDPLRLQITETDDKLLALLITSLENDNFIIKPGCLVFANACNSATSQAIFGDYVSFGWSFYLKGASVFIGTISAIPTESAIEFASIFYQELFFSDAYKLENSQVAKVIDRNSNDCDIIRAYKKAKDKIEIPLSVCYCFYGNPLRIKKLKRPQIKNSQNNIFLNALTNFTLAQ